MDLLTVMVAVPSVFWTMFLVYFTFPKKRVWSILDHAAKGKLNREYHALNLISLHLQTHRNDWKIDRDQAVFPKEGPQQIMVFRSDEGWKYSVNSSGGPALPLRGYFETSIPNAITSLFNSREALAVAKQLYGDDEKYKYLLGTSVKE